MNTIQMRYNTKIKIWNDKQFELSHYDKLLNKKESYPSLHCDEKGNQSNKKKARCSNKGFSKRNLRASYVNLFDTVLANKDIFTSFISLTFREEITDIKEANKKFSNWHRSVERSYPEFLYVGVPEFQKNGRVHYHLLTNISFENELIRKVLNEDGKQKSIYKPEKRKSYPVWEVKYWNNGFSLVVDLSNYDSNFNPAKYLAKYLMKDVDDRLYGHQKIMKSKKGLRKPIVMYSNEPVKDLAEFDLKFMKKGFLKDGYTKIINIPENENNKFAPSAMAVMKYKFSENMSDEQQEYVTSSIEDLEEYLQSL